MALAGEKAGSSIGDAREGEKAIATGAAQDGNFSLPVPVAFFVVAPDFVVASV